ncbi:MAG: efflux RND transporter periplasmic adaptor subunit [Chloroflexi bacterium]|nr:efflux RND transporter periplasmic adaptor subunit [Chloroflexota bacterium]MCI0649865.1 efflux RND transporter periplasmic adaptor subunit [Chloroflexota bacterium]
MKQYRLAGFLFLLLVTVALWGCGQRPGTTAATTTPGGATATPRPTRPAQEGVTILAEGQLVAVNPVLPLAFEVSGRLLSVSVRPGDAVAAGEAIATLDDGALQDAVTSAELQVALAENSLAQAQAALDELLNWQPDELAVALAEANLEAAQASLENAQAQDAAAGNSVTSARVNLDQAERAVTDAQEAYDTAWEPARDWELGDPFRSQLLENEREATTRNLEFAQENLEVARAQYNLALAGLNNDSAVNAEATVVSAQQALDQAQNGPAETEIAAARLQVDQAGISLAQSQFSLEQAQEALAQAQLLAPWSGAVLSVEVAPGAIAGAGTPIVTLLDTAHLQFHTTNLSERDLAQITPGQPVEIVLKAYPDQPITGAVAGIAPQAAGAIGDAAVFTIMIDLAETDLTLRPGMTGRAEITGVGQF